MVLIHELSATFVIALELDLLAYQARKKLPSTLSAGAQVPRTRYGWLIAHFRDTVRSRNNAIEKATLEFNRSRGVPLTTRVFKNKQQYARCLAPVEVDDDGAVVYLGAKDSVWATLCRKSPEEVIFGCQKTRAGAATSPRSSVHVMFKYGSGEILFPEMHMLNETWYKCVRKGGPHSKKKKEIKQVTRSFVKWMQARPKPWYPVSFGIAEGLCKSSVTTLDVSEPAVASHSKRKISSPSPAPVCTKKTKRKLNFESPVDNNGWSTASSCSVSDDGELEDDWIESAEKEWHHRPEPQRSAALRDLAHRLKVRDGETLQYSTLFAWASCQQQTNNGEAITQLIVKRCVQDKIGEKTYRKDLVPHYKVIYINSVGC